MIEIGRYINKIGFVISAGGAALWANQNEFGMAGVMVLICIVQFYFGWVFATDSIDE